MIDIIESYRKNNYVNSFDFNLDYKILKELKQNKNEEYLFILTLYLLPQIIVLDLKNKIYFICEVDFNDRCIDLLEDILIKEIDSKIKKKMEKSGFIFSYSNLSDNKIPIYQYYVKTNDGIFYEYERIIKKMPQKQKEFRFLTDKII